METCFMLSVKEELQLVRIAGDERQCANGYLLQLCRVDAARRCHRPTSRRMGHRIVRRKRLPHVPHDPKPSAHSEIARFIREYPIKSRIVICHIRRANRGRIALENTHPFTRELWGRSWSFAHNGQLRGIKKWPNAHFRPIGTTDSEHAFCWLMDQLRERWQGAPSPRALYLCLAELCGTLAEHGVFNVLLSDSKCLYCFCSTNLVWLTRRAPFQAATLIDEDLTVDFRKETTPHDIVTVIATRALTRDERWVSVERRKFVAFQGGELAFG